MDSSPNSNCATAMEQHFSTMDDHEYEAQQLICILFSESLRRALKQKLLTQEQVDTYDPALMFAIPRLAIVSGLLIYFSGPLSIDKPAEEMSDMFRPFRNALHKIRSLLWKLNKKEVMELKRLLATNVHVINMAAIKSLLSTEVICYPSHFDLDTGRFVSNYEGDHADCWDRYKPGSRKPTKKKANHLPDNIEVKTPITDDFKRHKEQTIDETDHEEDKQTDTFQETQTLSDTDRSRKTSKTESNDLSSLRNLSANGLMISDPLVINAAASTSSDVRQLPDHDLVTSLNEQVTEIADRLSSIATSDVDIIDQKHSFSTNDVPTLISTEDSEFNGPRNEQLSCMPSTSHGYLIPNAISHEPVVLSSLSHNNSAVFNEGDPIDLNNAVLNSELSLITPENIDFEINTNVTLSIANANLSSLQLNEEYRENFVNNETDNTSLHSAKMTKDNIENQVDKVKFRLGNESDHKSPVDSEVSTENTSLDRSPDQCKETFIQKSVLAEDNTNNTIGKTINISYTEKNTQKNKAGSSINRLTTENRLSSDNKLRPKNKLKPDRLSSEEEKQKAISSINLEARKVLQDWGMPMPENAEFKTIDDILVELRKHREEQQSKIDDDNSGSKNAVNRKKKNMFKYLRLNLDQFLDHRLSEDLIQHLYLCIARVADQLQTNFATDLRHILQAVFLMNQTPETPDPEKEKTTKIEHGATEGQVIQNAEGVNVGSNLGSTSDSRLGRRNRANSSTSSAAGAGTGAVRRVQRGPEWVPDVAASACMRCAAHFSAFRRRHHCRNCGRVFCASCSSHSIPLPRYGHQKPVRVCGECFRSMATTSRKQPQTSKDLKQL